MVHHTDRTVHGASPFGSRVPCLKQNNQGQAISLGARSATVAVLCSLTRTRKQVTKFGLRRQGGRYCLPPDIHSMPTQNLTQVGRWSWWEPAKTDC